MSKEFGQLESVEIRQAWAHEAREFTPWLATNLHRLSDAVGIDLELEGQEVAVGSFSADILARDRLTRNRVLIENQLEQTDHSHLGQILTYLAGLEAKTVIWISRSFRAEHLSAIRWLNLNTGPELSFHAVEISVVRIGDSPFAPMFKVVEQPNEWERGLKSTSPITEGEKPGDLAKAFWQETIARHPELANAGKAGPGGSNLWIPIPGTDYILSLAFSVKEVGWFIRGGVGVPDVNVASELMEIRHELEPELGVEMRIREVGWSGFCSWRKSDMRTRENWESSRKWLMEQKVLVLHVFEQRCRSAEPFR